MKSNKYNIIRTLEDLKKMDESLMDGDSPRFSRVAIDTETNGLQFWKDVIIGFSISTDRNSGYYIPLLTWERDETQSKEKKDIGTIFPNGKFRCLWSDKTYTENVTQKEFTPPKWVAKYLKRWFLNDSTQIIMHNAPFDCLMIEKNFGVDLSENLFCDTALLKHVLDENTSWALKETAILWQEDLGIPIEEEANREQIELGQSVIRNGGKYNKGNRQVWRGDLEIVGKYAIADTFLTYGVFEVGIDKFLKEYTEKHLDWFFQDEVMPLCREVVIPMKRNGVRINVQHFIEMEKETAQKLNELEDSIIKYLNDNKLLDGFKIGKGINETVTKKKLIEHLMALEGLEYPVVTDKKDTKKSLSKKAVEEAYNKNPHWLWSYLLGEGELKYSPEKLNEIKNKLYIEDTGRRYHFNIGSDYHMRWLFCSKLGNDPKKLPQTDSATPENPLPSMAAEVLENNFLSKYPFVKDLLLHKKLEKLHSTYILPAVNLNYNGYLYMDMMQNGTISGRFSCGGGFNLQTLPKVEEIDKCFKCGSKNVTIAKPLKLLAVSYCNDCEHWEEDILTPSAIKEGFIAPEGMDIVNADYSSLEPRCFAFMSGDEKLKEVYKDNLDLYSKVYCDMDDKEGKYSADPKAPNFLKKVDNSKRDMVKPVVLGIPYGARDPQVANLMGYKKIIMGYDGNPKEILDVERGAAFRRKYLETYKDLHDYMLKQEALANGYGFVDTIVGRRRHFKFAPKVFKLLDKAGIDYEKFLDEKNKALATVSYEGLRYDDLKKLSKDLNFGLFDDKGRQRDWAFVRSMYKNELNNAKNMPIQGLGAHITNRGMLEMTRAFKSVGVRAWVCLQVHDEITSYSDKRDTSNVVSLVRSSMQNNLYTKLVDIPMVAEPIVAQNLKESK